MNPSQNQNPISPTGPLPPTPATVNSAGNWAQVSPTALNNTAYGDTPDTMPNVEEIKTPTGYQTELGERGRSGTYIFSGIITQEEYNADLVRLQALWNYDVMRRSDATVKQLLNAVIMPIIGSQWTIQAASENDYDVMVANFVRQQLFQRRIVWHDFLREALLMLPFGFSVFEKVLEWVDYTHTPAPIPRDPADTDFDENGNALPLEPIQPPDKNMKLIGLAKLASRKQRSIFKWEMDNGMPGIHQILPGAAYDIPWEKLVVFTNEREGDNYEGISLLRAAYKHWYLKDKMYLIDAIKIEKQSLGILEIEPPEGADEDMINDAIEAAQQLRANEMGYFKKPTGWTFGFMDMKANTTVDTWPSIEHHDRAIAKTFLAQFLELGHSTGSGSHALSRDHSQLFEKAVDAVCKNLQATIQHFVINPLCDINFADINGNYPTLHHSKIHDDDIDVLMTGLSAMVTAGAITMDAGMEQWMRSMIGAPDVPDAFKEDYENRPGAKPVPNPAPEPTSQTNEPDDSDDTDNTANNNTEVTGNDPIEQARIVKANLLKYLDIAHDNANRKNRN